MNASNQFNPTGALPHGRGSCQHLSCQVKIRMLVALASILSGTAAIAQPGAPPDPALVDAIVHKLEVDGAIDRLVDHAIDRAIERRQEGAKQQASAQAAQRAKAARKVDAGRDHIRGNATAEVSLIEYSDFECPYCKKFHPTPMALLAQHKGRVNWVYRHFPLDFHNPAARREAIASECAAKLGGNELFWRYTDALFDYTQSNGKGLRNNKTEADVAQELGIKRKDFANCEKDPIVAQRVDQDVTEGGSIGVSGTPATVVRNNRTGASEWVVGAQPAAAFDAAIARALGAVK